MKSTCKIQKIDFFQKITFKFENVLLRNNFFLDFSNAENMHTHNYKKFKIRLEKQQIYEILKKLAYI